MVVMEIKVRLDSDNLPRHHYLLQITENWTTWYISKRYKQIYNLKISLEVELGVKWDRFPRKRLFNSYRDEVLRYRCGKFEEYFNYLTSLPEVMGSSLFGKFVKSDIFLYSYQEIGQSDTLYQGLRESRELENKVSLLIEELKDQKLKLTNLIEKVDIISGNVENIFGKNSKILEELCMIDGDRIKTHGEKLELISSIGELDDLYKSLRQGCRLIRGGNSQHEEKLSGYSNEAIKLEDDFDRINGLIVKLDDRYVNHYWKHVEYRQINELISKKLKKDLTEIALLF